MRRSGDRTKDEIWTAENAHCALLGIICLFCYFLHTFSSQLCNSTSMCVNISSQAIKEEKSLKMRHWVRLETYIVPNLALHNINLVRFFAGPEQYQFCPLFLREMQIYSLRDLPCSLSAKLAGNLSHPSSPVLSCKCTVHTSLPNFLVEAVIHRRLSNAIEWRWMPADMIRTQSS